MVVMDSERVVFEGFEGLKLVADVRGDPDACPVLFLHGGGQTRYAWGSTAETVAAQGWRTVAMDLRGHGDSDWADNGDYSFTAFCADCVAVVDQLGRPPVLVGASLGGMSAMLAEGTSDRTVSCGLVLVDITPKTNAPGIERIKTFMLSGVDGFDSLEDGGRIHRRVHPATEADHESGRPEEGPAPAGRSLVLALGPPVHRSWADRGGPRPSGRTARRGHQQHPRAHACLSMDC